MPKKTENAIRLARPADAHAFGALLYRFNIEFFSTYPGMYVCRSRSRYGTTLATRRLRTSRARRSP